MKTAVSFLRASTSTNPRASALFGTQFIPASLVMELYQMLQAGMYDPNDSDRDTGEPRFKLNQSYWRADPGQSYVLSGHLESPSEYAARKGGQQQGAPAGHGQPAHGAPAHGAPPPGWGAAPAAAPAHPPGQPLSGPMPQWGPPAGAPSASAAPPAAAPPPQAGGWGGGGWG